MMMYNLFIKNYLDNIIMKQKININFIKLKYYNKYKDKHFQNK